VGGVAAGKGNNGIGIAGAAFNADLAGIRLIAGGVTDQTEATALAYHRDDIDIYNNSWGPADIGTLGSIGPLALASIAQSVAQGRGGLGNIYTWAAGNGLGNNDNVNYDGYANLRYVIAVGAINHNGRQASYSEPGAAMLVTAHSNSAASPGITTTDNTGGSGSDPGDYTDSFGGTSSASPLVAGVIGLILQANPNLTYRDVQHILVRTARKTDPGDAGWSKNKAGLNINHKYGFGAVDATAAVNLAQAWTNVKPELQVPAPLVTVNKAIPDNGAAVSSSVTVAQNIKVEHVEVIFDATHTFRGDLEVILTAPSGTKSILAEQHASDGGDNYSKWMFSSVRHWGELSGGKWTLTVRDKSSGESGTFNNWQLQVYGTEGIPPVLSNLEATPISVLENKTAKLTNLISVSDPNSPMLGGAKVSISGNFQPGQDTLNFTTAGSITGAFDEGTGVLALSGAASLAQYQAALRSITYENTSDDPITAPRLISFQVADDTGTSSNVLSRSVTVIPVNDAPSFSAGGDVTVAEDAGPQAFFDWATNISPGPEAGQTVSLEIVSNDNPGLFAGDPHVTATGILTFTPAANVFGTANLKVRARDNGGTANGGVNVSASQSFQVVVVPVNDGPIANEDQYTVREEGTLTVAAPGVLGNDSDPESDPLSATQLTDVSNGNLTFNPDGSFIYIPDPDFSGQDSFTYQANEFEFDSPPVTVTINVAPVNDPPTANDDVAASDGNAVTINVLENDTDPDGDSLRVGSYTAPTLGRVTRSGGTLVYTPNPGKIGADVFSYTVVDAGGARSTATVTVNVTDVVAPEIRNVRVRYGGAASAVTDLEALSRTVLPWANVASFSFAFNEGVTVDPGALTLNGATTGPVTLNFSYNTASRTGTWTVAGGLLIDRYSMHLDASLVTDASANELGGDWAKSFAVLPGDLDGNGLVDDSDLRGIQSGFTVPGRPVNRLADVNGSGAVNTADLDAARTNHGKRV
jgi:subtilisin-like proprotein convertase family protein